MRWSENSDSMIPAKELMIGLSTKLLSIRVEVVAVGQKRIGNVKKKHYWESAESLRECHNLTR